MRVGLAIIALVLMTGGPPARAEDLANDGGAPFAFAGGFVAGEIAAARLVPSTTPVRLERVLFLFGGAAGVRDVTLHVWDDSADTTEPGASLFSGGFPVTASDAGFQDIDLSDQAILIGGPFRVGIELTADGLPSVAYDTDGTITAARNFVLASGLGWVESSVVQLTGDWAIRAVVPEPGAATGCAGALLALALLRRARQVGST